jgi:ubiquinone/menaquinone biosynthesis C-methylase UbiE
MTSVTDHFTLRAPRYDRSSRWCTDPELGARIVDAVAPEAHHQLLDVACGTGLVSRLFLDHVARVVGVDITRAMLDQALPHLHEWVEGPAERLPFADRTFDRAVCRQGLQFMDAPAAVRQMVRVTAPGGRVVLVHLVAHGPADRDEVFEILRLRNPARKNFFVRGDLTRLLADAGCSSVTEAHTVSAEDVDLWADNGAIDAVRLDAIRQVYRGASAGFRRLHDLQRADDHRWVDHMWFAVAVGQV